MRDRHYSPVLHQWRVQDICIYGDPTKSYVVALVCPARAAIAAMAARFGKSELSFEQLCGDKDITGGVLRDIVIQVTSLAAATTTIKEFKELFFYFFVKILEVQ